MKKLPLILGMLLGISILVNGMTIVRLMKDRNGSRDRSGSSSTDLVADAGSDEPSYANSPSEGTDLSAVLYELRKLRKEVASLKKNGASIGGQDSGKKDDASAHLASDPEVAKALAEKEAVDEFWADLKTLSGLKKSLGTEKHRAKVMQATMKFLGIDASQAAAFESASQFMFTELDQASANQKEASKGLKYDRENPQTYQAQYRSIWDRYKQEKEAALTRIDPYLTSSSRHKAFRDKVDTWLWYAGASSSWGGARGKRW